jgi:hypothetical protein
MAAVAALLLLVGWALLDFGRWRELLRLSRAELEQGITEDVIDALLGGAAEPVLACIVDAVGERDRELLDELERLVHEKRKELRRD